MKYVVTVNGEKFEVEVERAGRASSSLSRGPVERRSSTPVQEPVAPVATKVEAPKPAPVQESTPVSSGDNAILAPMPGTILDIKVAVGDKISVGDVVVVLEAMKMENEITSEYDGTVSAIKVKKGDTVDTDAVLVEIK